MGSAPTSSQAGDPLRHQAAHAATAASFNQQKPAASRAWVIAPGAPDGIDLMAEAITKPEKSGVDVIREALRQRAMKGSLSYIARDLSLPVHHLNDFISESAVL